MLDIDDFSRTLSLIYDSSLDPGRWHEALASLANLFRSPKAQISYYSSLADGFPFFEFFGFAHYGQHRDGARQQGGLKRDQRGSSGKGRRNGW